MVSDNNYPNDFEIAEIYSELIASEDYQELVYLCESESKRHPDDPYTQYHLGNAYVLNGEFKKAIEHMTPHLKIFPDNPDYQNVILDALFMTGRSEADFDWIVKPSIIRINAESLNSLYKYLLPKRKPRSIYDVYIHFVMEGYVCFTEKELLQALEKDSRFVMEPMEYVRVARKKDM